MKILIVNESNSKGGAAKAAFRLHKALLKNGIDCKMLVQNKQGDDCTILGPKTKIERGISIIRPTLEQWIIKRHIKRSANLFSSARLSNKKTIEAIRKYNPDIVHIHWSCGGTLSIEDFAKIDKPIVWTMHDDWPFSGGCHIKYNCTKYTQHCATCPELGSKKEKDLSYHIFERKKKYILPKKKLYIVALCEKYSRYAQNSSLFKNKPIYIIPNPIDISLFKPLEPAIARGILNVPLSKKIILFGAINPLKDKNKGFELLLQALAKIDLKDAELLIIGSSNSGIESLPLTIRFLGNLQDDYSLMLAYNAADVVVIPSKQETLSNMILESLACGTPVVAFDVGGNSDMIIHGKNGYLAQPYLADDIAKGIIQILENGKNIFSAFAVDYIREHFSEKVVATQMTNLYLHIMEHEKNDNKI
jgi:glycosyltransferase involved in cell wall biosynthesis